MVDIFISYVHQDRECAAKLAEAFSALGWSVWWDRRIVVGQRFDQAIERELEAAKTVVVLWSKNSIASEWVMNEAAVGAKRGVLIPALLESVQLPLEFSREQTADLTGWSGDASDPGFRALCDGIAAVLGRPLPTQPQRPSSTSWQDRRWLWIGVAVLVLALGYGVLRLTRTHTPPSANETPRTEGAELSDLVAGTYLGNINADLKGSSRSDVFVTVARIDGTRIRVTSDNSRIGTFEVTLTRIGDNLFNVGGASTLIAYTRKNPPELTFIARGEVSYGGAKTDRKPAREEPR